MSGYIEYIIYNIIMYTVGADNCPAPQWLGILRRSLISTSGRCVHDRHNQRFMIYSSDKTAALPFRMLHGREFVAWPPRGPVMPIGDSLKPPAHERPPPRLAD